MTTIEGPRRVSQISDGSEIAGYLRHLQRSEHTVTPADIAARTPRRSPSRPKGAVVERGCDDSTDWMSGAACRGLDPNLFHPARGDHTAALAAKAVCASCPVRLACLMYAIEHNELIGIWGGEDSRERRRLRYKLQRWSRCTTCGERFLKTKPNQRFCGCTSQRNRRVG